MTGQRNSLGGEDALDHERRCAQGFGRSREEEDPDTERHPRLQVQSQAIRVAMEESKRDLGQKPGPVTGIIGRRRPPMRDAAERFDRHFDYLMASRT